MYKYLIFIIIGIILFHNVRLDAQSTQGLFMTKELKNAAANGTRSLDGKPGVHYWQNKSDYAIKVVFNPELRSISGQEIIQYSNQSPDTLHIIYFNLIQDLFKKGTARDWDMGKVDLTEGVNIQSISIDGNVISMTSGQVFHNSTIMGVRLSEPILPHSQHAIEVAWSFVMPSKVNVRMGTYGKTNFMVAYWFPKLAVYDDVYGWANMPHTGRSEYYNEFGNFEVEITVPQGYSIWSTGLLQNADELYQKKYLKRIEEAKKSEEVVHIITEQDHAEGKILLAGDQLTWKFKAEKVPDFAFAVSNTYLWDASSIQSGTKRVSVNAVFKPSSPDFRTVVEIACKSIDFFSNESPKIEFPYPQITIFNGDGGMEFPGMVNDGDSKTLTGTLYVTSHEIGHSYFPFNTGLNEQRYAWMDEGLITFLPRKMVAKYTDDTSYTAFCDIIQAYNEKAGSEFEIPLMISSTNTGFAYRYHAYGRSSVAFYTLSDYLGEAKFDAALLEFSKRWEQKHPTPFDLFFTMNEIAGEDLAWFYKPWFFDLAYADLALGKFENNKIEVINKGGLPVAINLTVYADGKEIEISKKADVWKNGLQSLWIDLTELGNFKSVEKLVLDVKLTADAFPEDNVKHL